MTEIGKQIMQALWKQVFNPNELNANKLIKPSQRGSAPGEIEGFSRETVLERRKRIEAFVKKVEAEFELLLITSE